MAGVAAGVSVAEGDAVDDCRLGGGAWDECVGAFVGSWVRSAESGQGRENGCYFGLGLDSGSG